MTPKLPGVRRKEKYCWMSFLVIIIILMFSACKQEQKDSMTQITSEASSDLMFNDTQLKLANITTGVVRFGDIGQGLIISGRLVTNEDKVQRISSRAEGRIEKLYEKEIGKLIRQGEPLYNLYSESLLTLEKEYLLAKAQYESLGTSEKRYSSLLAAAEKKLLLFGLTKSQIGKLRENGTPTARTTFVAPASGTVKSIDVTEGQSVAEGTTLYQLEDVGVLWLEADLYPTEAQKVKIGDPINIRVIDNQTNIEGRVGFLSPEQRTNSRTTLMRAEIKNDGSMKSGMQVQVFIGKKNTKAIAIPIDAVIRDERGAHVYVQHGNNTFRPQMVVTGVEDGTRIEIKEGLSEGDTAAFTGAYLIYSEFILKRGADPMALHHGH